MYRTFCTKKLKSIVFSGLGLLLVTIVTVTSIIFVDATAEKGPPTDAKKVKDRVPRTQVAT